MAERNTVRFALITGATLIAMTGLAQLLPEVLGVAVAYGYIVSAVGLAVILFAWHVWVQTSPGGIDLEAYEQRPPRERLIDFASVVGASAVVSGVAAVIGIEGGVIEPDELWAGGTTSWVAALLVVLLGMAAGVYAGNQRNRDIRIQKETGRGE